jgi:hypothetical protein
MNVKIGISNPAFRGDLINHFALDPFFASSFCPYHHAFSTKPHA